MYTVILIVVITLPFIEDLLDAQSYASFFAFIHSLIQTATLLDRN